LSHVPSSGQVRAIAAAWSGAVVSDLTGRCAIVAHSSSAHQATRLFAALVRAQTDRLGIFREPLHALEWLEAGTATLGSETAPGEVVISSLWSFASARRMSQ
jgi:hypothetical protein